MHRADLRIRRGERARLDLLHQGHEQALLLGRPGFRRRDWRDEIAPIPSPLPSPPFGLRRLPLPAGGHRPGRPVVPTVRLSYRDVEELLAERGVEVDHVSIYRWVQRFAPEFAEAARARQHVVGDRWHVDETYVKVGGIWRYLFRALDQFGQVIDVYLSSRRICRMSRCGSRAAMSGP